jgi:hypothetical protein
MTAELGEQLLLELRRNLAPLCTTRSRRAVYALRPVKAGRAATLRCPTTRRVAARRIASGAAAGLGEAAGRSAAGTAVALAVNSGGVGAAIAPTSGTAATALATAGTTAAALTALVPALGQQVLGDGRLFEILLVLKRGKAGSGARGRPDLAVPDGAEGG